MATKKDDLKNENMPTNTTTRSGSSSGDFQSTGQQPFQAEQQHYQVNRAIDQTKDNVRRSIEEVRREIPEYAQSVTDYHQQAMDSAEEITENYLDSQKEIINSAQETWTNYLETVYWWMSPRKMAEMYTQTVSNTADNTVSASRIWNKTVLANMDASKAFLGRTKEASRDISRINVNTARTFERTSSQIRSGSSGERQQSGDRYRQR
jgi:hypothetical protein